MNIKEILSKKAIAGYLLLGAGAAVILCCAAALVINMNTNKNSANQSAEEIEFEEEQSETKTSTGTSSSSAEMIAIPGMEKWTIAAGETKVESGFYNPEKNNCYFVLSVSLKSTGEVIYQSKYLKPGQYLYEVELNRAIEAGEYEAILHYNTYSVTDNTPLNGASVPFTLVAK